MSYGDGVKGFIIQSPLDSKVILSRNDIFNKFFMLHSKFEEDLGKAKDVTKQMEFESPIIKILQ